MKSNNTFSNKRIHFFRSSMLLYLPALSVIALGVIGLGGCRAERKVEFEPNMVFAKSLEIQTGSSMKIALEQTQEALKRMFGTPTDLRLPALLK